MTASTELTALCARTLDNLKAENIIALDLRNVDSSPADYFVICSANSETHARALTDALARVTVSVGERRPRTEGRDTGEWVLLDYFDVVVHIFRTTAREYYKLEKLWGDAPALDLKQLIEKPKAAKQKSAKADTTKTEATKVPSAKTAAAKPTAASKVNSAKTASSKVTTPKAAKEKAVKEKTIKEKVTKEADVEKTTAKKAAAKAPAKAISKVVSATAAAKKTVKTSTKTNAETSAQASVEAPKLKRTTQKASEGDETKVVTATKPKKAAPKAEAAPKAKASVKKVSAK
ncbi:MAG: ribosome silencing factor [Candidatus Kapabacteria bacterium]|nr:ribosome silencing factor [Candidatus Kapabacteria bacterium]